MVQGASVFSIIARLFRYLQSKNPCRGVVVLCLRLLISEVTLMGGLSSLIRAFDIDPSGVPNIQSRRRFH
jgi:hypothetical protein